MKLFAWRYLFLFSALLTGATLLPLSEKSAMSQSIRINQNISPAFKEKADKDSIVVNGIEFQAVLSKQVIQENGGVITQSNTFPIPKEVNIETPNTPLNFTEIGIGIYATNKTSKPIFLGAYGDIFASILKQNGVSVKPQTKRFSEAILRLKPVSIQPGERVVIPLLGKLYWAENHLELLLSGFPSGPLIFRDIEPGVNKLQLTYFNDKDEVDLPIFSHSFSTSKEPRREHPYLHASPDLQPRMGAWKEKAVLVPIKFNLINKQK